MIPMSEIFWISQLTIGQLDNHSIHNICIHVKCTFTCTFDTSVHLLPRNCFWYWNTFNFRCIKIFGQAVFRCVTFTFQKSHFITVLLVQNQARVLVIHTTLLKDKLLFQLTMSSIFLQLQLHELALRSCTDCTRRWICRNGTRTSNLRFSMAVRMRTKAERYYINANH